MSNLILVWLGLLAICVFMVARGRGAGALLLAYFLGLSLIHVPGALNFLGNTGIPGKVETLRGFEATLAGMAALLGGALVERAGARRTTRMPLSDPDGTALRRSGAVLFALGIASYFVVTPLAGIIPSATALLSAIGSLIIVGFWAYLYEAVGRNDRRRVLMLFAGLPLLPLSTLATGGFLGYGIYWLIAILSFVFAISRRRAIFYFLAPVVAYLGLSLAIAYFAERNEIREAVWQRNAGYTERFDRILDVAAAFELYDWNNLNHVTPIDARLNQNYLVGAGILRHERGATSLLYGATVPWWTLVPRAAWADKPNVGGGGEVVTAFTGIPFAVGTSVGAGQPLEFYANFGWPGVVAGFALLGFILSRLDRSLAWSFHRGDLRGILVHGLPGLALLQPGGNLLEIVVAVVGAAIAARLAYAGIRAANWLPRESVRSRQISAPRNLRSAR